MNNPEQLQIAGLQPLSTVDWPGKLAAVLFLQGCPWRCVYCHNHQILDPRRPGEVSWGEVLELLGRRRGLLDGVVFSGGEATRQAAVVEAAGMVREEGFAVGLHTAGAYPANFERLLQAGVVDWVGLDIKALPGDYQDVTLVGSSGAKAKAALETLMKHPEVDHEVRLTLWHDELSYAVRVAKWCRARGVRNFALQRANAQGAPSGFVLPRREWSENEARSALAEIGFDQVTIRM